MNKINDFISKFNECGLKSRILIDEPMSKHTSFKIGGNADVFIYVNDFNEFQKIIELNEETDLPITFVGNGTNLLVKDNGIRGIVIKYCDSKYEINDNYVKVSSGMVNALLANILVENELSGFEFASCIPGTIGGAIYMNAGAYNGEMKNIVEDVTYLDLDDKKIYTIKNDDCKFCYRNSIFENRNYFILNSTLKLEKDKKENIINKMDVYRNARLEKQPLDKPNAGSIFKRKDDVIPARIIDEIGLKGLSVGDAEISTKHAGFIINKGKASANDVIELINLIKKKVFEEKNIKLETEVRIIGE